VAGTNTIVNAGTISSDAFAIFGNAQDDVVTNTGLIDGRIDLGGGANTVTNEGIIEGDILLGGGNDFYDGRGGRVTGGIDGGAGNDTIIGGDWVDSVFGGANNDTVDLGGGDDFFSASPGSDHNDIVNGGLGIDTYSAFNATAAVFIDLTEGMAIGLSIGTDQLENIENAEGTSFADTLLGNEIANSLRGADAADTLSGAGGNDTLQGGDGADTLTGGLGRDLLSGNSFSIGFPDGEVDIFDFNTALESGVTAATRDRITDFEDGLDKIDLSTIDAKTFLKGNQAFSFIGGGNFTAAGGQIRVSLTAQSNTLIQINTDHDKVAEMTLVVLGAPTLSAADFIL
jgi:Ca2+-binding RTX toxin-like protein